MIEHSEPTLTREQAAEFLGCSPQNISYLVRHGHLRNVGQGRTCAILASSVTAYAPRRRIPREARTLSARRFHDDSQPPTRDLGVGLIELTERVTRVEALVASLLGEPSRARAEGGVAQRLVDMEEVAVRLSAAAEKLRDAGEAEARTNRLLRQALEAQAQAADALRQADREREAAMLPLLIRPPTSESSR